jgi:secreted trypsin-like serine protease
MCILLSPNGSGPRSHQDSFLGGASLIAPGIVLTAAHKVDRISPSLLVVRCGVWDRINNHKDKPWEELKVRRITIHPAYNKNILTNNFALIHLDGEFNLTDHIDTICLPKTPDILDGVDQKSCVATGFGKETFQGEYQNTLKQVDLSIVKNKDCQKILRVKNGDDYILDESFVCAGGVQEEGDTCRGDGGGPLVCEKSGSGELYVQVILTIMAAGEIRLLPGLTLCK